MKELLSELEMRRLIAKEIDGMKPGLKAFARQKLIPLSKKTLIWEYGNEEEHPSWVFADLGERNVFAAYCLGGFGSLGSPWGLIFANESHFGMDSGWYSRFEDLLTDGWYEEKV